MPKSDQRGTIQLIVLLILLLGLVGGVLLVTRGEPLKFLPKAGGGISGPIGPETSFTLIGPNDCAEGFLCTLQFIMPPEEREEFSVKLYARSDIEEANLFTAKINFPKDIVEVKEIRMESRFNEVENFYDNSSGEISIVGGVPTPGLRTEVGGESALMAAIIFRAKTIGKGTVSFEDTSAIYSNLNNIDILTIKRPYDISVEGKPSATPVASPTPTATPSIGPQLIVNTSELSSRGKFAVVWNGIPNPHNSDKMVISSSTRGDILTLILNFNCRPTAFNGLPQTNGVCDIDRNSGYGGFPNGSYSVRLISGNTNGVLATATFDINAPYPSPSSSVSPPPGNGDGNGDGKIDFVDLSILLTDFNKNGGFRTGIDLNGDEIINTFDFSLMRNLLIQKGVIRG